MCCQRATASSKTHCHGSYPPHHGETRKNRPSHKCLAGSTSNQPLSSRPCCRRSPAYKTQYQRLGKHRVILSDNMFHGRDPSDSLRGSVVARSVSAELQSEMVVLLGAYSRWIDTLGHSCAARYGTTKTRVLRLLTCQFNPCFLLWRLLPFPGPNFARHKITMATLHKCPHTVL